MSLCPFELSVILGLFSPLQYTLERRAGLLLALKFLVKVLKGNRRPGRSFRMSLELSGKEGASSILQVTVPR